VKAFLALLAAFCLCSPLAAEDHEGEEFERNEIAGFVGITHERRENGFALGAEYKRRPTPDFGIGFLAERTWVTPTSGCSWSPSAVKLSDGYLRLPPVWSAARKRETRC
jgi:hypothetical protein